MEPAPVDLSHLDGKTVFPAVLRSARGALPASYDLRAHGRVTSVKDQDPFGTCWTFAAMASLESTFLPALSADYSEYHLAYFAYVSTDQYPAFTTSTPGFGDNPIFDQGGQAWKSTAILSRWTGAVSEDDCPYDPSGDRVPTGNEVVRAHLQRTMFLGDSRPLSSDIKVALQAYGAVSVRIEWSNSCYSADKFSYYNQGVSAGGHAVTIVGWDDDYSASNFNVDPGGKGAWLVKNSWGKSWGDRGYFWLSYRDKSLANPAIFFGESASNYVRNYQYDPLGWVTDYGFGSTTAHFANVFTAQATEQIEAVAFYVAVPGASYDISVYTNVSGGPTTGILSLSGQTGTLSAPGFYTIPLKTPVVVSSGKKFSVLVKLTTPDYRYPIAVEHADAGYSEQATANPGESFVSSDDVTWKDTVSIDRTMNVCLKAFAGTYSGPTPTPVTTVTPTVTTTPHSGGGGGCAALGMLPGAALLVPFLLVFRRRR
jgi:Synergist-CTERM protein sorting domain-containing protein